MGQAASMCRFRGCRYKKNHKSKQLQQQQQQRHLNLSITNIKVASSSTQQEINETTIEQQQQQQQQQQTEPLLSLSVTEATVAASGLHLRSIEEPASQLFVQQQLPQQQQLQQQQQHNNNNCLAVGHRASSMELSVASAGGSVGYVNEQNLFGCRNSISPSATTIALATATTTATFSYHQPYNQQQQQQLNSSKVYDAEYARMEAWLDENQEFVQDYFIRKATRQVVDAWLVSHATTAGTDICISPTHSNPNGQQSCACSRGGSGATTPVRKISAHEFERGGLLKPIVNTIDGTPTFLSITTMQSDCSGSNMLSTAMTAAAAGTTTITKANSNNSINSNCNNNNNNNSNNNTSNINNISNNGISANANDGNNMQQQQNNTTTNCHLCHQQHYNYTATNSHYYPHNHHHLHHHHHHNYHYRMQRLSRNELKQLDEKQLIFELVKDICNELEVRTLCHKILQNVSILLNADRGSLFLVQGRCSASDGPKKYLVSKLFDVCPRSTVEEMEQQDEVQIAWGTGIAGHVAQSGEPINIPDAYQDERFNCEIDTLTGYRTKTLLCMPIKDSAGDVIGVAQVINKLNGECFTETDEKVFASYLQFCGIGLRNAQLYEKSQLEIKRNQVLLDLARMIFEEQSTIEHMVFRILTHMQSLIQCQRVQILLVHEASKGSFSRVFDFEANDLSDEDNSKARTSPFESRFPINIGITGYVAATGETVSISNAYEDDRFDASVDADSSFKHKTILCMAIKNSLGQIIGVIQLINKFDNLEFTKNDENFVEAFAIFCGMGIHNTHMYEKAIAAMAKQSVTLEVLSYHASATIDEAHRLRRLRVPSAAHFRLHDFRFDDVHFEDDDTLRACLRMFLDLDFVERFHIDYEVLCRWLLSVKKNYRNVTYHNWRHAFNVAQMMFAILTATQWWKIFGEIECLALIIACLCHDLDHRGTNNSFQIKASSPLAQLYSTSTMEHHHFDQCLMILNSPGNQILANLSSEDYCRVIKVLEDAILSTDLAVYLRKRTTFLQNVDEQPFSYWLNDEPRGLLRGMCMTLCDLSAITKPWEIEKRVADLVSSEFFEQGDMEKQELNITPIDLMNREKEDELPMMQVGFIESICLPMYEAFSKLSDKLEPLVEGVRNNRQHWIELAEEVQAKKTKQANGVIKSSDESHSDDSSNICSIKKRSKDSKYMNKYKLDEFGAKRTQTFDCEEVETGIEADDDDSDNDDDINDDDDDLGSNSCYSSNCGRMSTPPPTGEEDSSPTSPIKRTDPTVITTAIPKPSENQAKLIAANLENLEQKLPLGQLQTTPAPASTSSSIKARSCDCLRIHKSSSLKWTNELKQSYKNDYHYHRHRNYSRSTPSMNNCGTTRNTQFCCYQCRRHYNHHHRNNNHYNNHYNSSSSSNHYYCQYKMHHHHQHHKNYHGRSSSSGCGCDSGNSLFGGGGGAVSGGSNISNTSSLSESDKIPKIVGKLNNLDTLLHHEHHKQQQPEHHQHLANGNAFNISNGHFNFIPANLLTKQQQTTKMIARRHSETNGNVLVMFGNSNKPKAATIVSAGGCDNVNCDK